MTIKAVTFDIWDTIVDDNSDEPKRAAQGLRSKHDERRYLVWEALSKVEPIELGEVIRAYDVAEAAYNVVWKELHVTMTVEQRMRIVLKGLNRTLPEDILSKLIEDKERMEVDIPPDLIEGIGEAVADLAQRYKLWIVSDTIVTPGRGMREILEHYGLKQYFAGFSFSDEIGYAKPHRAMFDKAADHLGIGLDEIVHIGDRDHNDIKGPHALGAKAVLFTATRPDDKDMTTADAICDVARDLPGIVNRLAAT